VWAIRLFLSFLNLPAALCAVGLKSRAKKTEPGPVLSGCERPAECVSLHEAYEPLRSWPTSIITRHDRHEPAACGGALRLPFRFPNRRTQRRRVFFCVAGNESSSIEFAWAPALGERQCLRLQTFLSEQKCLTSAPSELAIVFRRSITARWPRTIECSQSNTRAFDLLPASRALKPFLVGIVSGALLIDRPDGIAGRTRKDAWSKRARKNDLNRPLRYPPLGVA
jgi:hypothetical protein